MNSIANIRKLYSPIQPAIPQPAENIRYHEFLPHSGLQNMIYCYWQLQTLDPLTEPFNYTVVADGCIDVFFELRNPTESFVTGFCNQFTAFPLDERFNYVGIRFLPTIFPQLFKINAGELSNRTEQLAFVVPALANYIHERIDPDINIEGVISRLDNYFLSLLSAITFNDDQRLYEAIEIIFRNFGMVGIEKDLDTGLSPRQLQRLFNFYIGDTAKTFSKVVRFQNILNANPSSKSLRHNKLFFDFGFYDQTHFIKEFKNFYGITPARAFGK